MENAINIKKGWMTIINKDKKGHKIIKKTMINKHQRGNKIIKYWIRMLIKVKFKKKGKTTMKQEKD